jgi:homoserine dehydrogenase
VSAEVRVALFGVGGVGRAFLGLIEGRAAPIVMVCAADSRGAMLGELSAADVARWKAAGAPDRVVGSTPGELVARTKPDVVVDLTSCDFETAEPSLAILRAGLGAGLPVVTANKSPLARYGAELRARAGGWHRIGCAAAAGAALPAAAVASALARTDRIDSIEGVLTGTTTFVLDEMRRGVSVQDATKVAQEAGIAEPDPGIDLGGWDTAAKLVVLASLVWEDLDLDLDGVAVSGIEAADPSAEGLQRLVGRAQRRGDEVAARVEPEVLDPGHPLSALRGRDKGVVFRGEAIGEVVVTGGRSHPGAAAAAALGDVLRLTEVAS